MFLGLWHEQEISGGVEDDLFENFVDYSKRRLSERLRYLRFQNLSSC